jgi:hypothetical protein
MKKNFNWNEVERICDRCSHSILNEYTLSQYKKMPNFLRENWMLFCRCQGRGISQQQAYEIEMQEEYNMKKNNFNQK